jgi:putative inorganic carbon (HCO3(-)) transporter
MGTVDASTPTAGLVSGCLETGDEELLSAGFAAPTHGSAVARPERMRLAYAGLMLFMVVYCARPEDWIPGVTRIPFAKVAALAALAGLGLSVARQPRVLRQLPRETVYLILLFVQLCLTIPFSPVWRGGAFYKVFGGFSKIVLIAPIIVLAVDSLRRLRRLLFIQAIAVAAMAVAAVWENPRQSGVFERLSGVLGGAFSNPNDFAFAIALSFPFCWMFLLETSSLLKKSAWALLMVVMLYAVLSTYSRGGLLALGASAGLSAWEFGVKGRRRGLVAFAALVALGLALLASPVQYVNRAKTILHPDLDSTGSAQARRMELRRSLEVTAEHPLFGVGPGNFQIVAGDWHETHNTFTQFSAEAGIPALTLFLLILRRSFLNLRHAERLTSRPRHRLYAGAIRASLAGFVIGSCFASVAYLFFPYFLAGYASALGRIASQSNAQPAQARQAAERADFMASSGTEHQPLTPI